MELIGALGSPYTRRVAVSLAMMGLKFLHRPLSVLGQFADFAEINPVVKAPTLITDEGVMMMDSSLILEYAASLPEARRQLTPDDPAVLARSQRIVGLGLVTCEKSIQIMYETRLRPEEARWPALTERAGGQLAAAVGQLNRELESVEGWLFGDLPTQADITAAIAWRCAQGSAPGRVTPTTHAALAAHAERAEDLAEFRAYAPPG